MSVECTAARGYGFIVPISRIHAMSEEDADNFYEDDYSICMNAYTESDCFFGIIQEMCEPGEHLPMDMIRRPEHNQLMNMIEHYKTFFPEEENYMPHNYIICIID